MLARQGRRSFLQFLGAGLTRVVLPGSALGPLACAQPPTLHQPPFTPIEPSSLDAVVLPAGFEHQMLAVWGDRLPGTNDRFGYNADYTAFIPTTPGADEGVLFVNHEYVSLPERGEIGVYLQTFPAVMGRAPSIEDQMHDVGASVLHIKRRADRRWEIIASPHTRRYDATSSMLASGPALLNVRDFAGTIANCSGCLTPWNTVLTCEENFQDYVPEAVDTAGRGSVGGSFGRDGSHFGWVVEIDPLDPAWTPVKHTMLGRFRHENVAIRAETGRPIVAYMGDDRTNGHVYRFVSDTPYDPQSAGQPWHDSIARSFVRCRVQPQWNRRVA